MKHPIPTLIGAALVAAFAAGPAWTQGGGPSSPTSPSSPGSTGTTGSAPAGKSGATGAAAKLSRADRTFVEDAAEAGLAEVAEGKVVVQRAQDPAVKQYAQKMVDEHGAANEALMRLAQQKGITLPSDADRRQRREIESLQKRSGADFDSAYVKAQVADHRKTVALFEKRARSGQDEDLKQWAAKTLPTLQQHLQMARDLESGHAGRAGAGSGPATQADSTSGPGASPGMTSR